MKATITLTFSEFGNTKYHYPVTIDTPVSISDIATQICKQIMAAQVKKKMRWSGKKEVMPGYNLLMKLLPKALDGLGLEFNLSEKLNTKEQAFRMAHEANQNPPITKMECPDCKGNGCEKCNYHGFIYHVMWQRVGRSPGDVICIDIDNPDFDHAIFMQIHIEDLLGYLFFLNGSWHHGELCSFQLIGSKRYPSKDDWLYDNCRILNHSLKRDEMKDYLRKLKVLDESTKDTGRDFADVLRLSELYDSWGDYDIMHVALAIKHRKTTLRISKKESDDKYGLIE